MKYRSASLAVLLSIMTSIPAMSQFNNPKNLEFTWKTDTSIASVDLSEITLVLPKGTFPKINYPAFLEKNEGLEAFFIREPVIAVDINGEAKAYPLAMLTIHEISNDILNGVPILATFCPLCNAGVVFDRRIPTEAGAQELEFEVSGMLRKSDMVMLDTESESLWQQFMGEAIVGRHTGTFLKVIPSLIISVEEFFDRYPEGQILSPHTAQGEQEQAYGTNPYVGYDDPDASPYERYFASADVDPRLPAMERVIDIEVKGNYKIYPFKEVARKGVVQDRFQDYEVVLFHGGKSVSVLDAKQISESRTIGSVTVFHPVIDGQKLHFKKNRTHFTDQETGSLWDLTGRCLKGRLEGRQLPIVPHSNHFAFAWLAFYPESEIYGQ